MGINQRQELKTLAPRILQILEERNGQGQGEEGIYEEVIVPFKMVFEQLK